MKISPVVKKETARIALGVCVLSAVMLGIFALCGRFDLTVLWGALFGSAYAITNFFLMAYTIQRATESKHTQAKAKIQISYTLRNLLMLAVGITGMIAPCFHWLAVILPFLFPRLSIHLMHILKLESRPASAEAENTAKGRESQDE